MPLGVKVGVLVPTAFGFVPFWAMWSRSAARRWGCRWRSRCSRQLMVNDPCAPTSEGARRRSAAAVVTLILVTESPLGQLRAQGRRPARQPGTLRGRATARHGEII